MNWKIVTLLQNNWRKSWIIEENLKYYRKNYKIREVSVDGISTNQCGTAGKNLQGRNESQNQIPPRCADNSQVKLNHENLDNSFKYNFLSFPYFRLQYQNVGYLLAVSKIFQVYQIDLKIIFSFNYGTVKV